VRLGLFNYIANSEKDRLVAARGEECASLESNIEFKKKKIENRVKELHGKELHWQFFRQSERAASNKT